MGAQIAWVGHVQEGPDGKETYVVDREGKTRPELEAAFPPHRNSERAGMKFNRAALVRAVILEAFTEAQEGHAREPKNVRSFWYERLLYTLRTVAGDTGPQYCLDNEISKQWGELVGAGLVTYTGMNIYSEKTGAYHIAVARDSPYPTSIVLVEKEAYFGVLHDLADTYEISFVATGGQSSRCAALEYLAQLEKLDIDLGQPFTVYSFCDFDPEGWAIPEGFIEHLKLKITGPVNLVRLGLLREQISDSVLAYQGTPYAPKSKAESAKKASRTKWDRFEAATGGISMPGTDTPARVEIEMYSGEQIRERILRGLAQHIEGFPYQVRYFRPGIFALYDGAWEAVAEETIGELSSEFSPYFGAIEEAQEGLEEELDNRNQGLEEHGQIAKAEAEIARLKAEVAPEISRLKAEYGAEVERLESILDDKLTRIADDLREKTAPLDSEVEQLVNTIDYKLSPITNQQRALNGLEAQLETNQEYYKRGLKQRVEPFEYEFGPFELIKKIKENGGWRAWAENDVCLDILDGGALADAARRGGKLYYSWNHEEEKRVTGWIAAELCAAVETMEYFDMPNLPETPEAMIAVALMTDEYGEQPWTV